ncbi:MFS transporter [Aliiroseovarius sp. PTFE2010]|uniref:MFS transporter n=1 Tax=Aliiroseovarius sp. PTFE2010 TaxID=3417190 RepID=UPI003CE94E00
MAEPSARKRIWGWFFFDWASQPYHTSLVTFVFGPFFAAVAAQYFMSQGYSDLVADARAQSAWSLCLTLTGLIIGIGAPVMGALADTAGRRIPWIVAFSVMYIVGAGALWFTDPAGSNMWFMLAAFGLGFVGAEYALIFTNAQLPTLGAKDEIGEISGSGFAFGYLGGLVALMIALALFVEQGNGLTLLNRPPAFGFDASAREGTRFIGPLVAIWYAVFMIPYFLWVRDLDKSAKGGSFGQAMRSLKGSIKSLGRRRSLAAFLGGSMLYRDALNGLYSFGGVYATLVLDWELTSIGVFGIVSIIAAAAFSWIGGKADKRFGPKPVIIAAILVLIGVCITVVFMSREFFFWVTLAPGSALPDTVFFICGVLIGGMGGTLQAASRSMMTRHTDADRSTEEFGLYGLSGRATAFIAPALIGIVTAATGSARIGVSPLIPLFLLGLVLLVWVKPQGESQQSWSPDLQPS